MYRCGICGKCSEPGQDRKTHVVYREVPNTKVVGRWAGDRFVQPTRREIDREIPVCLECDGNLLAGMTLHEVQVMNGAAPTVAPQPRPDPTPVQSGRVVQTIRPK
jgi:hypothetical protein